MKENKLIKNRTKTYVDENTFYLDRNMFRIENN